MVSRSNNKEDSFLEALDIHKGDVVCLSGAGGKTSLMFRLAGEAKEQGLKVLVTTSTKILVPDAELYDEIDLTGNLFSPVSASVPGVYVGGGTTSVAGKITGVGMDLLSSQRKYFDLVLIEADGAAGKPLKGWNSTEPVIPEFATKTIGILDIQTLGSIICEALVHRLEIFSEITGCKEGEPVTTGHLCRVILHDKGLFYHSQGAKILYINKVESVADRSTVDDLREKFGNLKIAAGSVQQGTIYV